VLERRPPGLQASGILAVHNASKDARDPPTRCRRSRQVVLIRCLRYALRKFTGSFNFLEDLKAYVH